MFKLSEKEAENLMWKDILEEDRPNFTENFQSSVLEAVRKIRELK